MVVRLRLEKRFGVISVYAMAATPLIFVPYVHYLERLNRIEFFGHALTLIAFITIALYGTFRARRLGRRGIARLLSAFLVLGYAGTLSFQIGHFLALPMIGSFILGTALIFQSEEAKYLRSPA